MMQRAESSERRKFPRTREAAMIFYSIKSPLEVMMEFGSHEFNAVAADVSQRGIGIITSQQIPAGTSIATRFMLFDAMAASSQERTRAIRIDGIARYVVWVLKEKSYRVGIEFTRCSEQDRDFIAFFVRSRESNA